MGYRHHGLKSLALAAILGILAGLAGCDLDAPPAVPNPNPKPVDPDTVRVDTVRPDTASGRKALARLAKSMPRLPIPMGTRYFSSPAPAAKAAAAQACKGEQDVFAIPPNPRGILGIDTVTYLDTLGVAHCAHQDPTLREDHARYLFDPASGEAWERIKIEIAPDDLLPRHRSHGTGRLRLISGLEAEIQAYEVDMALDNATGMPIFQDAHLRLATSDGLVLRLDLVKAHPFRAADFYAYWEDTPPGKPVMGGPVLRGADTVGKAMLYADRTFGYVDTAGNPVTPE
jgi:hypothetical protein